MARIQVLHLPCAEEEHAFALVIDQWEGTPPVTNEQATGIKDAIGARGVIFFEGVVDVD